MKKKMITLAAFAILTITSAFANGADVSKNALATFSSSFATATDVKWEENETYFKASFQLNGRYLNALLSEEGEMLAVSRNILSTDLPINLQTALGKNFSACWITDLTEYAVGNETLYFITVENADDKITLESVGTFDWSVTKKIAK